MRRAAMVNMRPSCPLPSTPSTEPGLIIGVAAPKPRRAEGGSWELFVPDLLGLLLAERAQLRAQVGPRIREDRHRQQPGVGGAGLADGQHAHGDSAGHLYD